MDAKPWWRAHLKSVAVVTLIVVGTGLVMRLSEGEAGVARAFFVKLMKGHSAVAGAIDWQHLKAMDVDVGATYTGLANDHERASYRAIFLLSIAKGFEQTGARTGDFIRWRVHARSAGRTVFAADYPKKGRTILLTFSDSAGNKQLGGIEWLAPASP